MPFKEIKKAGKVLQCECGRCGYEWESEKDKDDLPVQCPKCKSTYWNKERKREERKSDENGKD